MSDRFRYGILVVWPGLWLAIAESIVGIFTLGYYVPCWDCDWMFWAGIKYTKAFRRVL